MGDLYEAFWEAWDAKDVDRMREIHHEEYIYLQPHKMWDYTEHMTYLAESLEKEEWTRRNPSLIFEDDETLIYTFELHRGDGTSEKVRTLVLKEDGKFWRATLKTYDM